MIRSRLRPFVCPAVYLLAWVLLGWVAVPLCRSILANLLDGPTVPEPTRWILLAGPPGCVAFGLLGATGLLAAQGLTSSTFWKKGAWVVLGLAWIGAAGALLLPLVLGIL